MTDLNEKLTAAIDGTIVEGKQIAIQRHPWTIEPAVSTTTSLPAAGKFRLTVEHTSKAECTATCPHMDPLLELATQFEYLQYRFMKLERID